MSESQHSALPETADGLLTQLSGADSLLAHLAASDVPCPRCGQSLRGTTTGRCAECGETATIEAIARTAGGRIAPLTWFIATAAAGLHLVTSAEHWRSLGWDWATYRNTALADPLLHALAKILSGGFWLLVPLLTLFLLGAQGWFARRSRTEQWLIAAGCIVLALLTHRRWWLRMF